MSFSRSVLLRSRKYTSTTPFHSSYERSASNRFFANSAARISRKCCCYAPNAKSLIPPTFRNTKVRQLHTSNPLQSLPKVPPKSRHNPNPNLDRFLSEGKRKYNIFKLSTWRDAYYENPKSMIFALTFSITAIALITLTVHHYYVTYLRPLNRYPDQVAKYLRRAIYYDLKNEMDKSIKNFQTAIRIMMAMDMDPLSDEFTGLKIRYAEALEKVKAYPNAVEYLEKLRVEMLELMEERKEELGVIGKLNTMKRVVGSAVKIGELQLKMGQEGLAERTFEWCVAQTLGIAREQSMLPESEERPWAAEEVAGVLENMAALYENSNKFDYASTLYLQAANLFHPPTCHTVILLNNVGACNMQRRIPSSEPMDRATQLESAKQWVIKALEIAATIAPPERTEECDTACVVSLHNLGEMEEQLGRIDEAKLKYQEAESLARALGFTEGLLNSKNALARLQKKEEGVGQEQKEGRLPPVTFKEDK